MDQDFRLFSQNLIFTQFFFSPENAFSSNNAFTDYVFVMMWQKSCNLSCDNSRKLGKHQTFCSHFFFLVIRDGKEICWTYRFDFKANIHFMSRNLPMGKKVSMFSKWKNNKVVWSIPEHRLRCAKLCFNLLLTNFFLMLLMRIVIASFYF